MKVSVIIATFNRREVLQRCLSEYSKQTHPEVEIIVADNGSSDDTLTVLPALFPHVKFIAMGSEHGPLALNRAAELASGELLWRTDDDAYPASENTLSNGVRFLESHPGVIAITGEIIEATIGFKPLDYYPFPQPKNWDVNEGLPINEFCGAASMIRRREFLEAGGFWDRFYLEELDLSARLIAAGGEIRYTPIVGVVHLSAFSSNRKIEERWLLQATQTVRYQWKYFSLLRALYRSVVVVAAMTLSAMFHRFTFKMYVIGMRRMIRAAVSARVTERIVFNRQQMRSITMGRSIWSQMFRYYRVRWSTRKNR